MFRLMSVVLVAGTVACAQGASPPAGSATSQAADTIYTGGDIVTVNDSQPSVEALAVKEGRIQALGTRGDVEKAHRGPATQIVDLGGKTLVPSFIDAHGHYISALTVANQVNLYAPPAGPGTDPDAIVAELVKFRAARKIPRGELIQAYGYDENVMPKGNLLNRDHLDKALPENPVIVGHVSMHGAVLNSAALKQFGISAQTKTPAGGVIVRKPGTQEPWGLIMETAYLPVFAALPKPTREQETDWSRAGQMLYAQAGITTAHEGATHAEDLAVMQRATAAGANTIDVVAYPFMTDVQKIVAVNPVAGWNTYDRHLKIGGVKITADGSPQGQDRLLHHAVPDRRTRRREELARGTDDPAGDAQHAGQAGLRHERAAHRSHQRRRRRRHVPDGLRSGPGRRLQPSVERHDDPHPVHAQGPHREVRE